MVGRFTSHDGRQRNAPSVRFGNISMMPGEVISHCGSPHKAFLVEARSISGYSGSPVFVCIPPTDFDNLGYDDRGVIYGRHHGAIRLLLGVDCGHFYRSSPVLDKKGNPLADESGEERGWKVRDNTGMMIVVPGWRLLDVVNSDEYQAERAARDRALLDQAGGAVPD
jgi:hypothetical protein